MGGAEEHLHGVIAEALQTRAQDGSVAAEGEKRVLEMSPLLGTPVL